MHVQQRTHRGVSAGPYGHVEHITFEGCHVGVSNGSGGHDTGSPGGGLVCHVNPRAPYNQGYHDIKIIGCVFEATDEFTLDFDDRVNASGNHTASDVLIEGCTIKGGGVAGEKRFAYSICFEAPEGCVVRNNLIYRGYINTFKICKNEDPDPDRRPLVVEGNTFDLTVDNGVDTPQGVSMIRLHGDNTILRNNTIITDLPGRHRVRGRAGRDPQAVQRPEHPNRRQQGLRPLDRSAPAPRTRLRRHRQHDQLQLLLEHPPRGPADQQCGRLRQQHLVKQHLRALRGLRPAPSRECAAARRRTAGRSNAPQHVDPPSRLAQTLSRSPDLRVRAAPLPSLSQSTEPARVRGTERLAATDAGPASDSRALSPITCGNTAPAARKARNQRFIGYRVWSMNPHPMNEPMAVATRNANQKGRTPPPTGRGGGTA